MKKLGLLLLLLLVMFSLFALDFRSLAMGDSSISLIDSSDSFFANPASLFFKETSNSLRFNTRYSDLFSPDKIKANQSNAWIQNPISSNDIQFIGSNVALSLMLENDMKAEDENEPREIFTAINSTKIRFSLAFGWDNFAFGLSALGGGKSQRLQITIRKEYTLLDYIMQAYLERYVNIVDSVFYKVNVSSVWKMNENSKLNFVFGNIIDNETNALTFSWSEISQGFSFGYSYEGSKFDAENKLRFLVFNGIVEANNLLDPDKFSLNLGMEISFQLTSLVHFDVRGGLVSGPYSTKTDFEDKALGTLGIGYTTDLMGINLAVILPEFGAFSDGDVTINLGLDIFF
ncbi:MAG: hypothetical protein WC162_09245 [Sphaerochaetaceae bacterium]